MAGSPLSLRFAGVIVAATVAGIFPGCWEGTTRSVRATVLAVEGPAMINAGARGQSVPLIPDGQTGQGDILEMTGSSRAAISLLPNLLVQLDRKARLEILRLALTKDGNETGASIRARYAELKLISGRMFVSQVWGEAIAKLSVITPQGELVTTSNALFCVESGEHKTRVTCVSGSVEFRSHDAETSTAIPPGFVGEWSASSASMVAAESETRGQDDLQEGLEIDEKLRALSNQRHFVLPR